MVAEGEDTGQWDAHYKVPHMPVDPGQLHPDDENYVATQHFDGVPMEEALAAAVAEMESDICLLYTSPSPRDAHES
eukprot:7302532-Prymnesium_polylepis.1